MESKTKNRKKKKKVTEGIIPILQEWGLADFWISQSLPYAAVVTPFQSYSVEMLKPFSESNLITGLQKSSFNFGALDKLLSTRTSGEQQVKLAFSTVFFFLNKINFG